MPDLQGSFGYDGLTFRLPPQLKGEPRIQGRDDDAGYGGEPSHRPTVLVEPVDEVRRRRDLGGVSPR